MPGLGLGLGVRLMQPALMARYSLGGKAPAVIADTVAGVYGLGGRSVGLYGLFSFSRLSAAWKLNALGHWVKVLAGEPRTGHHVWKGGKLVPAGIAVCSEVRTNHVTLSTKFETGWSGTDVTVTANTHISPDGTMNADTLARVGETLGYLIKSSAGVTGQTKSIYARTVSGTGTVGLLSHNSVPASEVALTEEWQRFDLPADTAETGGSNFYAVDFRVGDLTEVVVWGAQLEDGPYVTDHIPTDGSAASVASESFQIDAADLSAALDGVMPEALTLVMKGTMSYADEGLNPQVRMMLWQADSSNRIRLQLNTVDARTGQFIAFTQEDGVANSALSASDAYSPGVEVPFSVAAVLTATEIEGFYNGVSTGKVAHGGLPNLLAAPMEFFSPGTGTITEFCLWPEALTSSTLLEATA